MKRRVLTRRVAPAVLRSKEHRRSYSWPEIEKFLARGDVKDRVARNDLPTPALLLDLDSFEYNIRKMTQHVREHNLALRPHAKTHKCPEIAKLLIRAGAVGACTAKISEAEVFAQNGISGLLITTPVIGKYKIERAVRLSAKRPDTIFSVDNTQNARDLNDAAREARIRLNLAIDLLVWNRTGVQPGLPALGLAQAIEAMPFVKLAGIQAYAGQATDVAGWKERRRVSHEAMAEAVETRRLLESKGIAVPLLTGGSTATYNIDSEIEGMTELQPGSFIFMDLAYNAIGGKDGPVYRDFRNSLTVLTTVISKPFRELAVVDGGFKAFSTDQPFMPSAKNIQGIKYSWGGDEHGMLDLTQASQMVNVGDHMEFIIPHCDPSVNLYDRIFCMRGSKVEAVWKIAARGMSQ
jgi:D-serine deaminase-like pyridoxal phosphate-dependent protein